MAEDNGNGKEPLGRKGISDLIALMEANNKSTQKIEVDGRNTRRHLLDMKKMQADVISLNKRVAFGFDNFTDVMSGDSLQEKEDSMDRATIFEEIRDAIKDLPQETGKATVEADNKSGPLGRIGGMLTGVGVAAAGIGIGIGMIFSQAPKLIEAFENMDVDKIKENVTTLLSINEEVEKQGNVFAEGGKFFTVMTALGVGLGIFAVGGTAAAAAQKFQDDNFAEDIKKSVATLLSIADLNTEDTGEVFNALGAIGTGLVAFGIGSFFANAASDEVAKTVKESVKTYLSIAELNTGDSEAVNLALKRLGGGLTAFGIGSFFANASDSSQAENVRDSVKVLLEISQDPNANPEAMNLAKQALKSLGSGLTAFGVGSFFGKASNEGQGETIRANVQSLLKIGGEGDQAEIDKTVGALTSLGDGLSAFGKGSFVGAITGAAADAINFLRGEKSPIEAAISLGEKADTVDEGTDAFNRFKDALNSFEDISIDFDAKGFAEQLQGMTELIQKSVLGGKIEGGIFGFGDLKLVGLANLEADVDKSIATIKRLRDVLTLETNGGGTMSPGSNVDGMNVNTLSAENAILKIPEGGGNNQNVVLAGGSSSSSSSNVVITQPPPDGPTGAEQNVR